MLFFLLYRYNILKENIDYIPLSKKCCTIYNKDNPKGYRKKQYNRILIT